MSEENLSRYLGNIYYSGFWPVQTNLQTIELGIGCSTTKPENGMRWISNLGDDAKISLTSEGLNPLGLNTVAEKSVFQWYRAELTAREQGCAIPTQDQFMEILGEMADCKPDKNQSFEGKAFEKIIKRFPNLGPTAWMQNDIREVLGVGVEIIFWTSTKAEAIDGEEKQICICIDMRKRLCYPRSLRSDCWLSVRPVIRSVQK
ncbi:MAG: hypothetical protein NTZ80_04340, partial [Patescibacteria group bacterium]|nr:hypothetical protein [Patescibacteria group bacterium]